MSDGVGVQGTLKDYPFHIAVGKDSGDAQVASSQKLPHNVPQFQKQIATQEFIEHPIPALDSKTIRQPTDHRFRVRDLETLH